MHGETCKFSLTGTNILKTRNLRDKPLVPDGPDTRKYKISKIVCHPRKMTVPMKQVQTRQAHTQPLH